MTFLLNIIPILIGLVGFGFTYFFLFKRDNFKAAGWTALITFIGYFVYFSIQPSYIPKTGIAPMKRMELVKEVPDISDRVKKKEMTTEERSEHFETNVLTYDDQIKSILGENK